MKFFTVYRNFKLVLVCVFLFCDSGWEICLTEGVATFFQIFEIFTLIFEVGNFFFKRFDLTTHAVFIWVEQEIYGCNSESLIKRTNHTKRLRKLCPTSSESKYNEDVCHLKLRTNYFLIFKTSSHELFQLNSDYTFFVIFNRTEGSKEGKKVFFFKKKNIINKSDFRLSVPVYIHEIGWVLAQMLFCYSVWAKNSTYFTPKKIM